MAPVAFGPSPTASASTITLGPPQYRALWVDAFHDGIKSPAQVEKLVADAHRGNLNALIVQVRKRGDAYFNLSDEPRATDIQGPPGFDPLAYVIQLAHASTPRIEVHAWLNTFFVGDTSAVFAKHRSAWGNLSNTGTKSGLFDPGVPDVLTYTHKIFMDVAKNYDIDGLHMDYVRYPGVEWGYNPTAIALYKSQTGATSTPAPEDEAWKAWRRGRVTAFVRDLHADLKRTKPNVILSGALIAYGGGPSSAAGWHLTSAYGDVFQDWYAWLANRYIDLGVVMNYDSAWDGLEQAWFMSWLAFEKNSGFGNRILTGVGGFMNYPKTRWRRSAWRSRPLQTASVCLESRSIRMGRHRFTGMPTTTTALLWLPACRASRTTRVPATASRQPPEAASSTAHSWTSCGNPTCTGTWHKGGLRPRASSRGRPQCLR